MSDLDSNNPSSDAGNSDPAPQPAPFTLSLPDDPASNKDWYLWAGVLVILVLVSFWPAIQGKFLWDDDHYVSQNYALRDFEGLKHIWVPPIATPQYYPLTHTLLWIEWHLWKDATLGYHLINLLLHAGSAILVWRLLRRLKISGAWIAAAIWAIHPLQVETVCWISEIKNVLSGILFFGSLWYYFEFAGLAESADSHPTFKLKNPWQALGLSFLLFAAALFAKTVVCALPAVLLVILWWKRKLSVKTVLPLIPYFILGAGLSFVTAHMETDPNGWIQATGPEWHLQPIQRLLIAGRGVWFYFAKLLLPINLTFNYPRIVPSPGDWLSWLYVIAAALIVIFFAAMQRRLGRGPLAAILFYLMMLFPSLGFFNTFPFRYSFVADHFQYLACLGLIVLIVGALARLFQAKTARATAADPKSPAPGQSAAAVLATALVIVLAATSWVRANVFSAPENLWLDTLAKNDKTSTNPGSWLAAYNLAIIRDHAIDIELENFYIARQQNDTDSAKQSLEQAANQADVAIQLYKQVLDNPTLPASERYLCHNGIGTVYVHFADFPNAKVPEYLKLASDQLEIAIAGEKQHAKFPDSTPYINMGLVKLRYARYLNDKLPSLPSTQPATRPTTRPATPAEKNVIDQAKLAFDYLDKSCALADRARSIPRVQYLAVQDLGKAAFNQGEAAFLLATMADRCNNQKDSNLYLHYAYQAYFGSLQINPTSIKANFQLALCLKQFDQLEAAKAYLIQALYLSQNKPFPEGYFEAGNILMQRALELSKIEDKRDEAYADMTSAILEYKEALNEQPNYPQAKTNLQDATAMLDKAVAAAKVRAATRAAATRAATRTTTAPSR